MNQIDVTLFSEYTSQIQSTVDRISKIIKGLRHFARDSSNEPLEQIKLEELIVSTIGLCSERFSQNKIDFIVKDIPNITLNCRSIQISQVLLNLLNNAFDAIEALSEKKIILPFRLIEGFIEIVVTDNGPGIPFAVQEKIMEPFFSTKPVGKGMGLGLSISRGIIEEHHGRLYFSSSPGQTQFVMKLPVLV